jgi:cytochrome c2
MNTRIAKIALLLITAISATAWAQDADLAEGKKQYESQCLVCHGALARPHSNAPATSPRSVVLVAMGESGGTSDIAVPLDPVPIAIAPPFGPYLGDVYGRLAGSVEGFNYSAAFLQALKGMEWNDAALDVWITNPQAWVPGVYMFYKQPDAEIRRNIIAYLKANK